MYYIQCIIHALYYAYSGKDLHGAVALVYAWHFTRDCVNIFEFFKCALSLLINIPVMIYLLVHKKPFSSSSVQALSWPLADTRLLNDKWTLMVLYLSCPVLGLHWILSHTWKSRLICCCWDVLCSFTELILTLWPFFDTQPACSVISIYFLHGN